MAMEEAADLEAEVSAVVRDLAAVGLGAVGWVEGEGRRCRTESAASTHNR